MKTETTKKPKMMKPFSPQYYKLALAALYAYAPRVYPCRECGGPVIYGYCCHRCKSYNP